MPINLVVGSQIAIRGLAVACVFDFNIIRVPREISPVLAVVQSDCRWVGGVARWAADFAAVLNKWLPNRCLLCVHEP